MEGLFLTILNMSISASWLIVAVLFIRIVLEKTKAPKGIRYVLWAFVAFRLLCPFSMESALSLIPSGETFSEEVMYGEKPEINSGIETLDNAVNPILSEQFAPESDTVLNGSSTDAGTGNTVDENIYVSNSINPMEALVGIGSTIWGIGIIVMLVYTLISYIRLRSTVNVSMHLRDNLWICDEIQSPFILGLINPRIYLPSHIEEAQIPYIVAHENEHLKYHDNWWKPLGFCILAIHWFNPLVWVAYIFMCRDIELACDERVIRLMDNEQKKMYSESLLLCSSPRHFISACPVAFGEIGIKERIKNVINYRTPATWIVGIGVVLCLVVAVCFLTNPENSSNFEKWTSSITSENIEWAEVSKYYEQETISYRIPKDEYEALCELLGTITNEKCSPESQIGEEMEGYTLTISRDEKLWKFLCLADGTVEVLFEDYKTGAQYGCEGEVLVIDNSELWNYIINTIDENGESEMTPTKAISYAFGAENRAKMTISEKGSERSCLISRESKVLGGLPSLYYEYEWERVDNPDVSTADMWVRITATDGFGEMVFWNVGEGIIECNISEDTTLYWKCIKAKEETSNPFFTSVWHFMNNVWSQSTYYTTHNSESWVQLIDIIGVEELYADYDGEEICHVFVDNSHGTMNRDDIVYYCTGETDIQKVLHVMVSTMIDALMEPSEHRPYVVTQYELDEMEVIQGSENVWFIPAIKGWYKYDGTDMGTFEEQLPYVEMNEDGLIPFFGQGSDGVFYYVLIKNGDVYRLERGSQMECKYNYLLGEIESN